MPFVELFMDIGRVDLASWKDRIVCQTITSCSCHIFGGTCQAPRLGNASLCSEDTRDTEAVKV